MNTSSHLLGLDLGEKNIGIALGEWQTKVTWSVRAIKFNPGYTRLIDNLDHIVQEWKPRVIICGSVNATQFEYQSLFTILQQRYALAIFFQLEDSSTDESRTRVMQLRTLSALSKKRAGSRDMRDALSASIILQRWLDTEKP
ncbi:MAG: Holliday junction resolvase RuvX [Methylacidiphilales bacterium]|nr:Holliday junction resolvase RuvX [Candidatus Methylacidiphilales bacterium]